MGELIDLDRYRERQVRRQAEASVGAPAAPVARSASGPAVFFFDLACPFSYLAAERVERILSDVEWIPVTITTAGERHPCHSRAERARAERQAADLRLPLVWPDPLRGRTLSALRAARFAQELEAGVQFALAAARLAFCGGFDLEDMDVLSEAAAAAGISPAGCVQAARDDSKDGALQAAARGLKERGIQRLPAINMQGSWLQGEGALAGAAALMQECSVRGGPLAPVG
ncbi:MAG: DsbA family protein [Solirubrobacterales bacterium]|nr:DsbA family protein [Solirubrobacterales bacterium]